MGKSNNLDDAHYNLFTDLEFARNEAKMAYEVAIDEQKYQAGFTFEVGDKKVRKRYRKDRKRKFVNLKNALQAMDKYLYSDLNDAMEELDLKVDVRTLPISDKDNVACVAQWEFRGFWRP